MNFFFPILLLVVIIGLSSLVDQSAGGRLTAVNGSLYVKWLYQQVGNELPPSNSELLTNANDRKRICEEITRSDYFHERDWGDKNLLIDMDDVYRRRSYRYRNIFTQIYQKPLKQIFNLPLSKLDEYTKYPYSLQQVRITLMFSVGNLSTTLQEEYVFVCLLMNPFTRELRPYYVSKEYNTVHNEDVSSDGHYIGGRFIFERSLLSGIRLHELIALAEEPAEAYVSPEFNIEHYYVWVRKANEPEIEAYDDPLCKLISPSSSNNQNDRLCGVVLGSMYFQSKIKKPSAPRHFANGCNKNEIAFQTHQKTSKSSKIYKEWTIYCEAWDVYNKLFVGFYISRAYNNNQLFVYSLLDGRLYLENLSTHTRIGILDASNGIG